MTVFFSTTPHPSSQEEGTTERTQNQHLPRENKERRGLQRERKTNISLEKTKERRDAAT